MSPTVHSPGSRDCFGKPVVLNVDGLDRQRGKWNALGQAALHVCEWLSVFTPTRVVTDARPIQDYYRTRYRKQSTLIGYGSDIPPGDHKLDEFNLQTRALCALRQPSRAGEQS